MLEKETILSEKSWIPTDYGFFHTKENIKFVKISNRDSLKDILKFFDLMSRQEKFGVICNSFKESDLQLLRDKKISYCIPEREIKIFSSKNSEIEGEPFSINEQLHKINPTIIVSPSGLEIVDTIFKLDESEIQSTPAKISKTYNLSRSKLSTIMTAFKVKKLFDLKGKLLDLPPTWWFESFNNPITKRKMTPFKTVKTRKYVLKGSNDLTQFQDKIIKLKEQKIEVEIGGISYLNLLGVLRSPEFDLLVRADQLVAVVELLDLRPAKKGEVANLVWITPLIGGIKSEKLEAKKICSTNALKRINVLRYLWGLNYDEERVKEERRNILEEYFNEIRKRHN